MSSAPEGVTRVQGHVGHGRHDTRSALVRQPRGHPSTSDFWVFLVSLEDGRRLSVAGLG